MQTSMDVSWYSWPAQRGSPSLPLLVASPKVRLRHQYLATFTDHSFKSDEITLDVLRGIQRIGVVAALTASVSTQNPFFLTAQLDHRA